MPVRTDIQFVPYGHRYWYDHMGAADAAIWERFISKYPEAFQQVAYDVAVGDGPSFDVTDGGRLHPNIKRIYQLRLDVLAIRRSQYFIIELKPRADIRAIGQVEGYERLCKREFPDILHFNKIIITDMEMPEVKFLANQANIELVVV